MSRKLLVAILTACTVLLTVPAAAMASSVDAKKVPTCVERDRGFVHVIVGYCP
jgi:hypothetical protein